MDRLYETAIGNQNFSAIIKLLDVAIEMFDGTSQSKEEYAQLLMNRAYCNQRLQLFRKALKVGQHVYQRICMLTVFFAIQQQSRRGAAVLPWTTLNLT